MGLNRHMIEKFSHTLLLCCLPGFYKLKRLFLPNKLSELTTEVLTGSIVLESADSNAQIIAVIISAGVTVSHRLWKSPRHVCVCWGRDGGLLLGWDERPMLYPLPSLSHQHLSRAQVPESEGERELLMGPL